MTIDCFNLGLIFFGQGESHVNDGAFNVFVFDFGFSQSRLAVKAPVHGLKATVNITFFHELSQNTDLSGFRVVAKREVGIVPIAQNA